MEERSCSQHVVLLGIGHTNAHIVRMWGMNPIPDADLTCLSNFSVSTYSGFLPAVLAGQKTVAEMEIDLVRLSASVGARLITDKVTGLDHQQNEVLFDNRPPVPFDVLSIGIGSVPSMAGVTVEGDSLLKIKPMQTFLTRLNDAIQQVQVQRKDLRIVVVGGGVAGVEVTFCLPGFLRSAGCDTHQLSLVTGSSDVLPEVLPRTREKVCREFKARGVMVTTDRRVVGVTPGEAKLDDGTTIHADLVIWATGAVAPPLLSQLELPLDDRGFLATDAALRSTSGRPVFAVGDTGTILSEKLPKAGVYAVRQGPVLWENIRRSLRGDALQQYQPQRSFLKLLNKGDGTAIGQWKGFAAEGRWVMWLKNRIDSRFMDMYRPQPMNSDDPMQCRGCGCKLGAGDLESALAGMGDIELEDAAEIGGPNMVASTDFFTSPLDDAYLVGRVAALHAASDILCSGAEVTHALANVVLPEGDAQTQQKTLSDFLAGARLEFDAMGGRIVGGHTIVGPRTEVGFTVIGKQIGDALIRKRNLKVGDQLFLTKPLGIGILLAAHMRSLLPAAAFQSLVDIMLQRQHDLVQIALQSGVTAATDVTGFGLAGHLIEMLQSSNVAAAVDLAAIPLLPGVEDCLQQGIESTLTPSNRRFLQQVNAATDHLQSPAYPVLIDPQTCGGMLLGVPTDSVDKMIESTRQAAVPEPVLIGVVTEFKSQSQLVNLR